MLDCLLGWPTWALVAVGIMGTLALGHVIVGDFNYWGRNHLLPVGEPRKVHALRAIWAGICFRDIEGASPHIPAWLTGAIERAIFATITVVDPSTAAVGMAGWLALKMAAKWQRDPPDSYSKEEWGSGAFLAVLTGLISMFIAGVGGYFIRWMMGLPVLPS